MNCLRAFLLHHRALALLLVAAALCMKAAVPTGYMIAPDAKVLTVQVCGDSTGYSFTRQMAIPMKGAPGEPAAQKGKSDCPYSSLAMTSLAAASQALLALALAFILTLGFAPARRDQPRRGLHFRPPLRGPPARR